MPETPDLYGMMKFVWALILGVALASCQSKDVSSEAEVSESEFEASPSVERSPTPMRSYVIDWPVDQARLTQKYHLTGRRPHLGIDLAAPRGSRIVASHHGTVVYTGNDFRGYGRLVIVEQNSTWATFYSHLDKILVKEGQMVEQGQLLGLMGKSGNARGVHLHFELRNNRDPVDPLLYLPGGSRL